MSRLVTFAAIQMACSNEYSENVEHASTLVKAAAQQDAQVILLPELFVGHYFCKEQKPEFFKQAQSAQNSDLLKHMSKLAKQHKVVLPISFFERAGQSYFNSLVMIDASGEIMGIYRKSHIPDGPGYQEKFYFSPGDTGFKVWATQYGSLGVGICWDQWFPEAARVMVLQGAEVLLYPTAIGDEPQDPTLDSQAHWQRTMQGHSAANMVPVIAANRVGQEPATSFSSTYYGSSFITGYTGEVLAQADRVQEHTVITTVDLDEAALARQSWGLFRDRRPELYGAINSFDGH
ncbi:N-carbamoylputrescine amidase [Zooshikella harenae]|uniref:N-carbamoylputrescine amidase n=1 Tax=Zooshikella harenae TaxID=2827238 RepID=A0ABS5ZD00_9GAMM|nr:N-carbamoylputrescine amidase [Zooshikella harenae]MBU2710817.1 N-carbamoylputrescine amidase [Zooshikella harenae]